MNLTSIDDIIDIVEENVEKVTPMADSLILKCDIERHLPSDFEMNREIALIESDKNTETNGSVCPPVIEKTLDAPLVDGTGELVEKTNLKIGPEGSQKCPISSKRGKEIILDSKNPDIDLIPSANSQKMIENGTLKSENILPLSAPSDKIRTKRQNYDHIKTKNPCEMAIIDPVIKPVSQLRNEKLVDKTNILLDKNDSIEKNAGLEASLGINSPKDLSENPRELGSIRRVGPEKFSDIIPKLKQANLVRLPDLGKVVLQSEIRTSNGKEARKIVKRKRRKKEEDSVDPSQPLINNFLSRKKEPSICTYGKRKSKDSKSEENKKGRVVPSD